MRSTLFLVTILMGLLSSCTKEKIEPTSIYALDYDNQVTKIEFLGEYTSLEAIQFLQLAGLDAPLETTCGFSLYRFHYKTRDFENKEEIVSGLVGVPKSSNIKGVFSWQHGTNTYRPGSISSPSTDEGIGLAAGFAGNDYLFVAADYIGLGVSTSVHPYYHMESTVNSIEDLIKIGAIILKELAPDNSNLYLSGFSQGAGASVATHRRLELFNATGLQIKGTAAISGAYNLAEISIPYTIEQSLVNGVIYMGYLANSYSHIYNVDIEDIIQGPYASKIPEYFDGTKDGSFLESNLPDNLQDFLQPSFISDVQNGILNPFLSYAHQNQTYRWVSESPVRFYFGSEDKDVSPEDSKNAFEYMSSQGGNVELYNLGNYNHDQSIVKALPHIQSWFNQISD